MSTTVKIQESTDEQLTLLVDGELQTIGNQLSELKTLLQNLKVQNIQYADKIYNIEHIDEANFGFVTGKRAFNELLTRRLIEAARRECAPINKFYERVQAIPHWEQDARISNKAKEMIAYSFVGIIGIQFSKLMAIGKEPLSEAKQQKYIRKCLTIAKHTLELVNFTLLSSLWDVQKNRSLVLSDPAKAAVQAFFERNFEASLPEQLQLLGALEQVFADHQLPHPFPEFNFQAATAGLEATTEALQTLNKTLDRSDYTLLHCTEAETSLADLYDIFFFLVNYKMASIKRIGYKQMRHADPRYLHRYAALGIDSKANVDAEKVYYVPDTVNTDAVLLYKGDSYEENINLFPLVIDYNALTFEHGVKVCFFQSKDLIDDTLEYRFLEDESIIHIEKKDILQPNVDYNELMLKEENQILLNLDQVRTAFEDARKTILQDTLNLDDF